MGDNVDASPDINSGGARLFIDALNDPAWLTDSSCTVTHVNAAWVEFTGCGEGDNLGEKWLDRVAPTDRHAASYACPSVIDTGAATKFEFRMRRADGQWRSMLCLASPWFTSDGVIGGLVGQCQDLTDRQEREEQLAFMASHDVLTGLPNRRTFVDELDRAVSHARRGDYGVLLLLDVDNFKAYNDALGHREGDQALVNFALLLQTHLRAGDLLARIGGDEFAVLLEKADIATAREIAERMRTAASHEEFVTDSRRYGLGLSAGLVRIDGRLDARELFDVADNAMYRAKELGRNRVEVHDPRFVAPPPHTRLAARIQKALREGSFVLHYQPVIRLGDGVVSYHESLVRMSDEDQLLTPAEFLPTVERLGLMPRLTRLVIRLVLQALRENRDATISVNLSGADLLDESLPRFIEESVDASGVSGDRLTFEMSESALMGNLAAGRYWIERISRLGSHFVLDDFGSGLGAFVFLRDLDVDQVKLGREIVGSLASDGGHHDFVGAIRSLVEAQGKIAVAAFVETDVMLERVRAIGFTHGQGYRLEEPSANINPRIAEE
ncbi:MAG: EAL domain-containing protein [Actinomycetota bacterium]|jgi:diguanylate cyclase (GGDEF)-like protein/PAS domain S-box-containing protein|nr:EAL domain-containing protein [Actinomycetota bacterium]